MNNEIYFQWYVELNIYKKYIFKSKGILKVYETKKPALKVRVFLYILVTYVRLFYKHDFLVMYF